MTHAQASEHIQQRTWHQSDLEKKRRLEMAQPAWKSEIQRRQQSVSSTAPAVSQPAMPPLETVHETMEESEVVEPMTQAPDSAQSDTASRESAEWTAWWDLQESSVQP